MTEVGTSSGSEWNVIVTCRQGGQRPVRRALHPLIHLRRSGFRNVLIGRVADVDALLLGVAAQLERRTRLAGALGKLRLVEHTFTIDPGCFEQQLGTEATVLIEKLMGRSFHVRVERRGHKGVINTQVTEKALGDSLYAGLQARGYTPTITFSDPDVVVAVEILGEVAGLGVVTREQRQQFSFVRID